MKLYWYTAKSKPKDNTVRVAMGLYGYKEPPKYEDIEAYDLRFVSHKSWEEIVAENEYT